VLPLALGLVIVASAASLVLRKHPEVPPPAVTSPAPEPRFVGGESCAGCHPREHDLWKGSHHALAMQPADAGTVLGDFRDASFTKDGVTSTFRRQGGRYVVRTDGPDGTLADYDVAYTFGVAPLQQYLFPFPGGRYQALGIAWDTRPVAAGGQRWFSLYPNERIDHRDVLHWTGLAQRWNYMCADCHSTNLKENYRLADDRFAPTWTDVAVSCEACHGPGSGHLAWAERARSGAPAPDSLRGFVFALKDTSGSRWALAPGESIARRTSPLPSRAEVETCAPCHARRAPIWGERRPGQPLEQSHRTALLEDTLYYPDGQILDEVYEYGSFLQSRMYQAGVTCSDCHEPHGAGLRRTGNDLCAQCHLPAKYDGPQHHFHAAGTEAARCVSCHMPERLYMVIDGRRDHSLRVPRPDLSVTLGTPNACTQCHANQSARWAADAVAKWYGAERRQGWHWAEAIHAGRSWQVDAESQLVRAATDPTVPAIARATALSLLPAYLSRGSVPAVETSLHDPDPLVRRAAATALRVLDPARRVALGAPLLGDPIRSVRFEALSGLLDTPRDAFPSADRAALDRATDEYRRAQVSLADRIESHVNLGTLDARLGHLDAAEAEYRTALRLQPAFLGAYINLADLYRQRGEEDRVRETLEEALRQDPTAAAAHEALGLSLVREKRLHDALLPLEKAATLRADEPRYAYVYAVALHEAGDTRRALQLLEQAHARHPAYRDILVALIEYHRHAGDTEATAAWARELAKLSPDDGG
jgi:predicted CXXCH cytochrome family protein